MDDLLPALNSLPGHLAERFRWLARSAVTAAAPGEFVLYWMHNALRAHENPALDVAIFLARQTRLPLLVYHALSEDYPFSSDRFHAFILQGHRDVQRELADRKIAAFFHLQRDEHRGPHLRDLTRRAAVLVTEEMPVQPLAGWLQQLVKRTSTPIGLVDSTCIVPVSMVKQAYTRAYQYRDATEHFYRQRVGQGYDEQSVDCSMYEGDLPFQPLDLQDVSLSSLIARCQIDHSIAPVPDTPGGSRAGYARWDQFKTEGLTLYAKRRNDASDHAGVSRMSAYLHFGMVSPLRIAREAHQRNAQKYLDELLIWRELSFHFCHHNININALDTLEVLPQWAQRTLQEHAVDPRDDDLSWERLARARSGQTLWDACQRSLLKHGELHNNVRMTWGKTLMPWTPSPGRALQLALDLNHRYALDGRDPSSYGGVLWCFGQFDRPFKPKQKVLGAVRPRSCDDHQKRINLKRYLRVVDRPIAMSLPSVAIIGAGIAGLIAARTLADHGLDVRILEKSHSVGGRLATRRYPDGRSFDHGAQYFTAQDPRFNRYVKSWIHDGLAKRWTGRIVELDSCGVIRGDKSDRPRFVGVPGMNAIAKHLASELEIQTQTRIQSLRRTDDTRWELVDDNAQPVGVFDVVIANCPPIQSRQILSGHVGFCDQIANVVMRPCWAVMLAAEGLSCVDYDAAFINQGRLSWIACDSAKPARSASTEQSHWILHASPDWSEEHLELDAEQVQQQLIDALESSIGQRIPRINFVKAHRWRYAIPANPLAEECLWDASANVGACGDWCGGPRIEGAFLSGMAMAGTLLRHLTIDRAPYRDRSKIVQPSLI